jgi:hypothetical protein
MSWKVVRLHDYLFGAYVNPSIIHQIKIIYIYIYIYIKSNHSSSSSNLFVMGPCFVFLGMQTTSTPLTFMTCHGKLFGFMIIIILCTCQSRPITIEVNKETKGHL